MSMDLETLSNHDAKPREIMKLGTHHFDVIQCVTCWRRGIGLRFDVRHIAPILNSITGNAGWTVGIAEDEAKNVSAIDHGVEVADLRFVRWVP